MTNCHLRKGRLPWLYGEKSLDVMEALRVRCLSGMTTQVFGVERNMDVVTNEWKNDSFTSVPESFQQVSVCISLRLSPGVVVGIKQERSGFKQHIRHMN